MKAKSGGTVLICPYCTPLMWHSRPDEAGEPKKATLYERGIVSQAMASNLEPIDV